MVEAQREMSEMNKARFVMSLHVSTHPGLVSEFSSVAMCRDFHVL
jgi:hypothetical protein